MSFTISDNDREMAAQLMAEGCTEDQAWSLVDDRYLEMQSEGEQ